MGITAQKKVVPAGKNAGHPIIHALWGSEVFERETMSRSGKNSDTGVRDKMKKMINITDCSFDTDRYRD